MRHNVNILFGDDLARIALATAKHFHKYGAPSVTDYIHLASLTRDESADITITDILRDAGDEDFTSDLAGDYRVCEGDRHTIRSSRFESDLSGYLSRLFAGRITINGTDDTNHLLLTLYVPACDNSLVTIARDIAVRAHDLPEGFDMDIVLLTADVMRCIAGKTDEETDTRAMHDNLSSLVALRNANRTFSHVVVIDNRNAKGLSLSLCEDSLARILGQYVLLIAENYSAVYNLADSFDQERPVDLLGLSVLNFDRYYYVHYLLRRAYLKMMDREQLMQEQVDTNKVEAIANRLLTEDVNLVEGMWNRLVAPLMERQMTDDEVVVAVRPQIDEMFGHICSHLQSFMDDESLSLPEKQAAMAMVIGEDDALLQGYSFNAKSLTIDDFDKSLSEFHINEHNAVARELKRPDEDMMHLPLDEIKDLRLKIRQSTNYIRQKTLDIESLGAQLENVSQADRRLTSEGFQFDGVTYRTLREDTERSLEETYKPRKVSEKSIDLRNNFTEIRNQGEQGSCSAFALTSIYEYVFKKSGTFNADLSEAYLYYNARKKSGKTNEDSGTSLYDCLEALREDGICEETAFPYSDNIYSQQPSEAAYEDGRKRRLLKAMSVNIAVDDLRSAISEGYPVAISMKIYDSFMTTGADAFLRHLSDEEREQEHSFHAMVICGYSDEEKVFIVRNSWGKSFGDRGYCYMPYCYVSHDEMIVNACIITAIDQKGLRMQGIDRKITLSFDRTNTLIRSAILHNLIEDEKIHLEQYTREYAQKRREYETQMESLGKPFVRQTIRDNAVDLKKQKIDKEKKELAYLHTQRSEAKSIFEKDRRRTTINLLIYNVSFILALIILVFGSWYYAGIYDTLTNWTPYIYSAIVVIIIGLTILFRWQYKAKATKFKLEWEQKINDQALHIKHLEDDLRVIDLKSHIYGAAVDKLLQMQATLKRRYQSFRGYVGNMRVWYDEERTRFNDMEPLVKDPFIPLLDNDTLDTYFKRNGERIIADTYLYRMLRETDISDDAIVAYKQRLKDKVVERLNDSFASFSVLKYILRQEQYPFLDSDYSNIPRLMPMMEKKSCVFMPHSTDAGGGTVSRTLFVHCDDQSEMALWRQQCQPHFRMAPQCLQSLDRFSLLLLQTERVSIDCIDR